MSRAGEPPANRRDAGLVRAVGPVSLAASTLSMIVGAGIFAVPGALAAGIGAYAPLAILVCALMIGAFAVCFAEAGSRVPSSGGAYAGIQAAFGPLAGYVAGTSLWIANVLASGGVAAALADVITSVLPPAAQAPARVLIVVGAFGGIAWVNLGGVARGARLVNVATVFKLLPLLLFVGVGAWAVKGSQLVPHAPPDAAGCGRALILVLFAFTGMETALCASGEVADPSRTIPRALAYALGTVTLLYLAIQVVAQGILGPDLAQSTVPLADAMGRVHPGLRVVMLAGAAMSMFGYLSSDVLGTPRMLFAFARDGRMPLFLGRLRARSNVPHFAISCYAALAGGLALSGSFAELAVLATLATAPLYILGCAAAWRLAARGVAEAGEPLRFRGLRVAAIAGVASMLAVVGMAAPEEILGLGALVAASIAVYRLQSRVPLLRA